MFYENLNANGNKKKKKTKAKNKKKKASSKTKKKKTEDAEDDETGAVDGVESDKSDEETGKDEACSSHPLLYIYRTHTLLLCTVPFHLHPKMSLFLSTITSHLACLSISHFGWSSTR